MVIGCVTFGLVGGLALAVGPLAGAQEHVITGAILLAGAASWAFLAWISTRWTRQPQRWAALPAGFMGMAGAGLLVFAPGDAAISALGWVWPPVWLAVLAVTTARARRELHGRTRAWVVYPVLATYALTALGAGYHTLRESLERRLFPPPGQLVDVGGHRLHLRCAGTGTPTVVLESGLGETGAYWGWVATAVAHDTRVCVYDRAGRGWSEPAAGPQDGAAVADDLHALLVRAGIPAPVVLVGHSSGAAYVRIFTSRHPEQVGAVVLLDGQPADAFERLPDFPAFYRTVRRVSALLPTLARMGVGRLVFHADFAGLPTEARDSQRRSSSSARLYRSLNEELAQLPATLQQARASRGFGDRPLIVVTASRDAQAGWLPLQDEMTALSTRGIHRMVPCTHASLVMDAAAAQASIQAIRELVASSSL
jgi:pimeloyl-ACP methyl ester carboxylesterase